MFKLARVIAIVFCFVASKTNLKLHSEKPNLNKWASVEPYLLRIINITTNEVKEFTETHKIDLIQSGIHIPGIWSTDDGAPE
eukprot:Awhi_evm1s9290